MQYAQYLAWTKGISPREFKRCSAKDVREIMAINNAVAGNAERNSKIEEMMSGLKW